MRHCIVGLAALQIVLLGTVSLAQTTRSLLKPPDRYHGFEVDGERYVVGQLHLDQFSDTTELKKLGFREFEFVGSDAWHKKVKAIWPLHTDVDALPEFVKGISYEKARNLEQASRAFNSDRVVTASAKDWNSVLSRRYVSSRNFSYRVTGSTSYRPASGSPGSRSFYTTYSTPQRTTLTMTTIGQMSIGTNRRELGLGSRGCR